MNNTAVIKCPFSVRLRRCLAWVIDWNILGGIALVLAGIAWGIAAATDQTAWYLLIIPIMLAWFVLFILRDVVFGRASIGKRIMGIHVVDKFTGEPASKKQRAIRGLSAFFIALDAIIMIACGYSIGDRFGDTAVVKDNFMFPAEAPTSGNGYVVTPDGRIVPVKTSKKTIALTIVAVVAVIVAFVILLTTIITISFKYVKQSEEYALAYDYLVTSEFFEYYDLDEEDVSLSGDSAATDGRTNIRTAAITFTIDGKQITVYCVRKNGVWYVDESASRLNTPTNEKIHL